MVIEGKLHAKFDQQQVSESFKKRDFVVEYVDNPLYPQYVSFQLTQDRVGLIDNIAVGEKIEVTFNLRGREWTSPQGEKKYFNTLEAWRLQKVESNASVPANSGSQPVMQMADIASDGADDLPF
jgi:translation initiation factor IF-3